MDTLTPDVSPVRPLLSTILGLGQSGLIVVRYPLSHWTELFPFNLRSPTGCPNNRGHVCELRSRASERTDLSSIEANRFPAAIFIM